MNFTFNLGELLGVGAALIFVGGSLESLRRLTASSISQGARLGKLEDWMAAQLAVATEREKVRRRADTRGVPVATDDET